MCFACLFTYLLIIFSNYFLEKHIWEEIALRSHVGSRLSCFPGTLGFLTQKLTKCLMNKWINVHQSTQIWDALKPPCIFPKFYKKEVSKSQCPQWAVIPEWASLHCNNKLCYFKGLTHTKKVPVLSMSHVHCRRQSYPVHLPPQGTQGETGCIAKVFTPWLSYVNGILKLHPHGRLTPLGHTLLSRVNRWPHLTSGAQKSAPG